MENGNGSALARLRMFIDCETVAQVAAVLATCEAVGVTPRMVPDVSSSARRSAATTVALGDGARVFGKGKAYFPKAAKLLAGGPMQRRELTFRFAEVAKIDRKLAGYWLKRWLTDGALTGA